MKWKPILALLSGLLVLSTTVGMASAETPIAHWEKHTSKTYADGGAYWKVYHSASLGYFGAYWIPSRGKWEYNFRVFGISRMVNYYNKDVNLIKSGHVEIKPVAGTFQIWLSDDEPYSAAYPLASNDHYNYGSFFEKLAYYAISKAPIIGDVVSVSDAIASLMSGGGKSGDTVTWTHAVIGTSKAWHALWFLVDVPDNTLIEFRVRDGVFAWDVGNVDVAWYVMIDSPDDPEAISALKLEEYGIRKIPVSEAIKMANDLGLRKEDIDYLKKGKDNYIYVMSKPKIIVSSKPILKEIDKKKGE
ncbi:hypothetical protein [Thermococcus sp.]